MKTPGRELGLTNASPNPQKRKRKMKGDGELSER